VIVAAVMLLVLHAVGTWTYAVLGVGAALVAALLVVAASIASARMAGAGRSAWFVVPTLLFTAVPLGGRLWTSLALEQSAWTRTVDLAPFLIGFAAPVLLLLGAYLELRGRAPEKPYVRHLTEPT
jgi:hypothetical protein